MVGSGSPAGATSGVCSAGSGSKWVVRWDSPPLPAIFGTWCLPGMAWDLRTQVCCLQAYLLGFLPLWTYSGRYPMESVTHGQLTGASDPCPHGLTCTKQAGELERGELLCTFSWICIGNAGLERT